MIPIILNYLYIYAFIFIYYVELNNFFLFSVLLLFIRKSLLNIHTKY